MVPADSSRVPRAPPYLGTTGRRIAFSPTRLSRSMAGLSRPVRLTLSYPSFNLPETPSPESPADYCGPTTPGSPCESPGLGYSEFARHYFRNHGCFLLLGVLRWFTSPGSPVHPMNSDARNGCSHPLGFPIRKSPDHSLLAASRSLSQLITSFIAFLRQGIHTHALSSLTIKSTSHITGATFALTLVFVNARQYSVVKDLDCLSNRQEALLPANC
jgi:hypothetical protein